MRVFLDTNGLVSAFTAHGLGTELFRYLTAEHELLIGEVVLHELERVLLDRFKASDRLVADVLGQLGEHTVVPKPRSKLKVAVHDPEDEWVLASAVVSGADLLVTGDRHLLDVAGDAPVAILSPRAAWERLRRS